VLSLAAPAARAQDLNATPVTLHADDTALADVLAELAPQVSRPIVAGGQDLPAVTVSFNAVPFGEVMTALCDMFGLVAAWQEGTLQVHTFASALAQVDGDLTKGQATGLLSLKTALDVPGSVYGSPDLLEAAREALKSLVARRAEEALAGEEVPPALALALARVPWLPSETRAGLAVVAIRGHLAQGDLPGAMQVWHVELENQVSWPAIVVSAELFLALHHAGSPEAQTFWESTFNVNNAALLVQEGWNQKAYRQALHLARLNIQYAAATGRQADALSLGTAVQTCLDGPRNVDVTCAVDVEACSDPHCDDKVRARVASVSETFAREFGIQFTPRDMVRWNPPPVSDFDRQYDALKAAIAGRRPELTVGFILEVIGMNPTDFDPGHRHLWTGFGCPHNGAYLLARDFSFEYDDGNAATEWTFSAGTVAETLTHETGHMFGALHVDDETSIMRPVWGDTPATAFDDLNRRAILLHKWQDMDQGAESLDEPELLALVDCYRQLAVASARPNGAAEEEARIHLALAHLYAERGQEELVGPELQDILTIGVPTEIVTQAKDMLQADNQAPGGQ
jgi:hypothetical protein